MFFSGLSLPVCLAKTQGVDFHSGNNVTSLMHNSLILKSLVILPKHTDFLRGTTFPAQGSFDSAGNFGEMGRRETGFLSQMNRRKLGLRGSRLLGLKPAQRSPQPLHLRRLRTRQSPRGECRYRRSYTSVEPASGSGDSSSLL